MPLVGEEHGIAFYDSSVRDAIAAVSAVVNHPRKSASDHRASERLLERLQRLADERDARARVLAELGGPETLLHGDLWLKNATVAPSAREPSIRLIDWDHVGPGSFAYDLSTLVLRFPVDERAQVVDLYRAAAATHGIRLPADEDLAELFATAECARLASIAIWPAIAAADGGPRWAFDQLAAIDHWFEPVQTPCAA
jgi:Ser/Thr protein kinase RdoA (MazF antagonist)